MVTYNSHCRKATRGGVRSLRDGLTGFSFIDLIKDHISSVYKSFKIS
jgi:hypothetical protein